MSPTLQGALMFVTVMVIFIVPALATWTCPNGGAKVDRRGQEIVA